MTPTDTIQNLTERAATAGEAGDSWHEFTYSACEEVAALDAAGVQVDTNALKSAWLKGRRAGRLAKGWLVRWTTAGEDYDQFGTETLEHCGDHHGRPLRRVLIDPEYAEYQIGRYGSGLHGCWEEDPREEERRWAEERAREKADDAARAERRRLGLEWLPTAPDELVLGDEDAFDEELRAHGLRWEDGRDERRRRRAKPEAEARAATWARCRAAVPDGAALIDLGSPGRESFYGWIPGRKPRAWRSVEVRPAYDCPDAADRARVVGEGEDDVGSLLDVAKAIEKGEMRLASPDEHVPPRKVVERIGVPFDQIVRVMEGDAWVGRQPCGDLLVLDNQAKLVRRRGLREAAVEEYRIRRNMR